MIPTVRAFIAGNSGSGKTYNSWKLYLQHFPRRIILDQTGEWYGRCDAYVSSLGACVAAIQQLAPRRRWSVAYTLDDDRFSDLVHWLIPVPNLDASPVKMVGGCVLLEDEVDLLAPQGVATVEVRTLHRRSRHVGLSIVSATQRPANVSREVSAQATQIVAHYLSEPRDRDYMTDVMRWLPADQQRWLDWCRQHPHGAVWKQTQTGQMLLLPDSGPAVSWYASGDLHARRQSQQVQGQSRQADQGDASEQAPVSQKKAAPQPPKQPPPQRQRSEPD